MGVWGERAIESIETLDRWIARAAMAASAEDVIDVT